MTLIPFTESSIDGITYYIIGTLWMHYNDVLDYVTMGHLSASSGGMGHTRYVELRGFLRGVI